MAGVMQKFLIASMFMWILPVGILYGFNNDLLPEVGLGLIGFGLSFTFLGVILYFDRGLLALGNLFWLIGVGLLLGWQSTWRLFTNINNLRGTVCFVLGLFLIFVHWPIFGIILEIYGCIVLFGGFWSTVKAFLSQIPFVGWIIQYPLMQPWYQPKSRNSTTSRPS